MLAAQLDANSQRLVAVTVGMFGSGDVAAALANSVIYLEAFGHVVVAWMWLEQYVATEEQSGDFYEGKRQAARFFYRYELADRTAARPVGEPGPHHQPTCAMPGSDMEGEAAGRSGGRHRCRGPLLAG